MFGRCIHGDQGLECFELLAGSLDRVVGLCEVLEVGNDVAHFVGGVGWLEHVAADDSLRLPTDFIETVW